MNSKSKKSTKIAAKNISQKYKNLKKPKKTFLVNEEDLEAIVYDEPEEDLFRAESILKAANKVLDFEEFKKQQEDAIKEMKKKNSASKKSTKIAAKKISQKYKNLEKPPKKHFL